MRVLEIEDLHTNLKTPAGTIALLNGVNLTISEGEIVGLVGESGCGKTMTARAIMRLLPASARITRGKVILNGTLDLTTASSEVLLNIRGSSISMVFQDPMTYLNPLLKNAAQISEPIIIHLGYDRSTAHQKALDLLSSVGIGDAERIGSEYPHQLSGGMRQRVMMAIALACNPRLLIADEPFTALDLSVQAQLVNLLKSKQQELRFATLLITHDLALTAEICDRLYIMYAGEIVEAGDVYELYDAPKHPYTKALLDCARIHEVADRTTVPFIAGTVPSFIEPPQGCRFHPRCPKRFSRCSEDNPVQFYSANPEDSWVRCWLYEG